MPKKILPGDRLTAKTVEEALNKDSGVFTFNKEHFQTQTLFGKTTVSLAVEPKKKAVSSSLTPASNPQTIRWSNNIAPLADSFQIADFDSQYVARIEERLSRTLYDLNGVYNSGVPCWIQWVREYHIYTNGTIGKITAEKGTADLTDPLNANRTPYIIADLAGC